DNFLYKGKSNLIRLLFLWSYVFSSLLGDLNFLCLFYFGRIFLKYYRKDAILKTCMYIIKQYLILQLKSPFKFAQVLFLVNIFQTRFQFCCFTRDGQDLIGNIHLELFFLSPCRKYLNLV